MLLFEGLFKPDVEKLERKKDIEGLLRALRYQKDPDVCRKAAWALGDIGDPQTVEPLIAALKDPHDYLRENAAYILGRIKDPIAVESLIITLSDSSSDVRKNAVMALGNIRDPKAVGPLSIALRDPDYLVRVSVAEALDKLKWTPGNDGTAAYYWISKNNFDQCIALGAPALEALTGALKNPNRSLRLNAVRALSRIKNPHAADPLSAALTDSDSDVRKYAAEALEEILIRQKDVTPVIAVQENSGDNWRHGGGRNFIG
jgi:HEAT repeat protein